MKVGLGYDVHAFSRDRKLIVGGVEIPYEMGLMGYSDADVLSHAVCDALLGAAGEGDIGKHFPNTDEKYKDICSLELLKKTEKLLKNKNYEIVNVDSVV
ncbi:MAG: 2-C-methyl-D-erythritol 2,4-cyclodiphosphate synthase, partial [Candidatus Aureabacteria bacterium]|nr:2-C-methyl-D-erythritol 2,4-cyclodiphosphate synthase [Candidatus Auribacterota bacterium]